MGSCALCAGPDLGDLWACPWKVQNRWVGLPAEGVFSPRISKIKQIFYSLKTGLGERPLSELNEKLYSS